MPLLERKKKSKLIRPEVILLYIRYFLRYRLETSHGDSLLHFKHFFDIIMYSPKVFLQVRLNLQSSRTVSQILKNRPHP